MTEGRSYYSLLSKFQLRRPGFFEIKKLLKVLRKDWRMHPKARFQNWILKIFRGTIVRNISYRWGKDQLDRLKKDKGLEKRYNAVKKALHSLSENPKHKSLKTREFTSLIGPKGEKIFEAYAEQSTPAAYRVFWYYGPDKNQIAIIAITPHP